MYFLHLVIALGPKSHIVDIVEHHMPSFSFIPFDSVALNLMKGVL